MSGAKHPDSLSARSLAFLLNGQLDTGQSMNEEVKGTLGYFSELAGSGYLPVYMDDIKRWDHFYLEDSSGKAVTVFREDFLAFVAADSSKTWKEASARLRKAHQNEFAEFHRLEKTLPRGKEEELRKKIAKLCAEIPAKERRGGNASKTRERAEALAGLLNRYVTLKGFLSTKSHAAKTAFLVRKMYRANPFWDEPAPSRRPPRPGTGQRKKRRESETIEDIILRLVQEKPSGRNEDIISRYYHGEYSDGLKFRPLPRAEKTLHQKIAKARKSLGIKPPRGRTPHR